MPFGSLSAAQQVMVRLYMLGGPQYRAEMEKAGLTTAKLGAATAAAGNQAMIARRKFSFLENQLRFTARRGLFYATLGTIALTAAVVHMGFSYSSTMQQSQVALRPVLKGTGELNTEMNKLFGVAAFTPFSFSQITQAFRIMYTGFQPLGISVQQINDLLSSTIDILSATGQLTPNSLKRVSNALQDMANIGTLTGITIGQLGRLGIPLRTILNKELGITGDQLQHVKDLGLDSKVVLQAIIDYANKNPLFKGAALRQSQETLFGAWSTFKDLLSQASGQAVGGKDQKSGIFGFLQRQLTGVNLQLQKFYTKGKPITITNIAEAFDKKLSPKTHIIINLFIFLNGVLIGFIATIYGVAKAIRILLTPFDYMLSLFGANEHAAKILGITVGVLLGLFVIGKTVTLGYALAVDVARIAQYGLRRAIALTTAAQKIQVLLMGGEAGVGLIGRWKSWAFAMTTSGKIMRGEEKAVLANNGRLAMLTRTVWTTAAAFTALDLAVGGLILLAALLTVGIVVLYFRWKRFHDIVNSTAGWVYKNWKWMQAIIFLIPLFGPLIWAAVTLQRNFGFLEMILEKIWDLLKKIGGAFKHLKPPGWLGKVLALANPVSALSLVGYEAYKHFPGGGGVNLAATGFNGASYLGGTNVIPLGAMRARQVTGIGLEHLRGRDDGKPIIVQLHVSRKVLAEEVARANQDAASRR